MASGLIPLRYARVARDDYKIKFSLRLRGKIISESERERERMHIRVRQKVKLGVDYERA